MKTMAISQFKSQALKVLNEVAKSKEPIIITKRGNPLAQVIAFRKSDIKSKPGKLANAFIFEKDIVSPLGKEGWEACQ